MAAAPITTVAGDRIFKTGWEDLKRKFSHNHKTPHEPAQLDPEKLKRQADFARIVVYFCYYQVEVGMFELLTIEYGNI